MVDSETEILWVETTIIGAEEFILPTINHWDTYAQLKDIVSCQSFPCCLMRLSIPVGVN